MHCQLKLNMNGLEERREMCLFNIKYILYEIPIRFEIIMIIIMEEDTRRVTIFVKCDYITKHSLSVRDDCLYQHITNNMWWSIYSDLCRLLLCDCNIKLSMTSNDDDASCGISSFNDDDRVCTISGHCALLLFFTHSLHLQ